MCRAVGYDCHDGVVLNLLLEKCVCQPASQPARTMTLERWYEAPSSISWSTTTAGVSPCAAAAAVIG